MKPNWDESPSWANWWAIDQGESDGFAEWGWYENSPYLDTASGLWFYRESEGKAEYSYVMNYEDGPAYKEKRPEEYR